MKINILKDICIGCGTCVALADGAFEMGADNKPLVKERPNNTDEEIINAARACPVSAIEIHSGSGNKLWPEN
ncbi:ferredoxin [Patescibacteria group bacterium]|nr:ferredoxin [Patescibacteria group bacterium]